MKYRINSAYRPEDHEVTLKIAGTKYYGRNKRGWQPDEEEIVGEVSASGRGNKKKTEDFLVTEKHEVPIRSYQKRNPIYRKTAGWIKVLPDGYLKVTKVRKLFFLIPLFILLLILVILMTPPKAPKKKPLNFLDQFKTRNEKNNPTASIQYASYESTPNLTWQAGTLTEKVTLSLPKQTTFKDKDGKTKTSENPVVAAPSIWVDLNKDGNFSDDECVFNQPKYDKNDLVTDPGKLLKPGKSIDTVTLMKEIPAGSYDAQTLWTPQTEDGSPANPMCFKWKLTVQ